ncbi:MAG TPA: hypothetical protein PLJ42_03920 [Chitinophagales bacterium]|jgi:CBS domain-containing protein|nr:hypothetical protein [Chitinophagales bacterium]MBP6155231.1 hypothetical protein [Chitinophagales bacterium]HQV77496.1 hypothetical protein [Chitinophagales bacterium]HQW78558.1 hypothetical protein [Chitinophagales bacterium]HRB18621.1 hypothetical protein [Chitinophagales bacterium]
MKNYICILFLFLPFTILAQKGIRIPEVKSTSKSINTNENYIKTWTIKSSILKCMDSLSCYSILENGIQKTIPIQDVSNFIFEDGYEYIVQVKQKLKEAPIQVFEDIYLYSVIKLVQKKIITSDASSIPVVTKDELQTNKQEPITPPVNSTNATNTIYYTNPESPITVSSLQNEVNDLKMQLKDFKKRLETMQLQLELQYKLLENKGK